MLQCSIAPRSMLYEYAPSSIGMLFDSKMLSVLWMGICPDVDSKDFQLEVKIEAETKTKTKTEAEAETEMDRKI